MKKLLFLLIIINLGVALPKKSPILYEIYYDKNGDIEIPVESKFRLDTTIVEAMIQQPELVLLITGHTNTVECPKEDTTLSYERALRVKKYIAEFGIFSSRIRCRGLGGMENYTYDEFEDLEKRNRRVRLNLYFNKFPE